MIIPPLKFNSDVILSSAKSAYKNAINLYSFVILATTLLLETKRKQTDDEAIINIGLDIRPTDAINSHLG